MPSPWAGPALWLRRPRQHLVPWTQFQVDVPSRGVMDVPLPPLQWMLGCFARIIVQDARLMGQRPVAAGQSAPEDCTVTYLPNSCSNQHEDERVSGAAEALGGGLRAGSANSAYLAAEPYYWRASGKDGVGGVGGEARRM